jgi:5'-nucleotidase
MHEGGRQAGGPNECIDFAGAAAGIVPQFDDAVDVVVSGHTHQNYVCDIDDGPLVTSAYQYGQMFTEITLLIDATGRSSTAWPTTVVSRRTSPPTRRSSR